MLGIISRSPTDVQPVLDAIVESAARVCGIDDVIAATPRGKHYGFAGSFRSHTHRAASRSVLMSHSLAGCASMARSTFPMCARRTISQAWVPAAVPHFLGCSPSSARDSLSEPERTSHRGAPLYPDADQAARNLRRPSRHRHRERAAVQRTGGTQRGLTEALEQQTATSEILGVIASSPTDIQPVLDAVAENAARLCEANDALFYRVEGRCHRLVASFGPLPIGPRRQRHVRSQPRSSRLALTERPFTFPTLSGGAGRISAKTGSSTFG